MSMATATLIALSAFIATSTHAPALTQIPAPASALARVPAPAQTPAHAADTTQAPQTSQAAQPSPSPAGAPAAAEAIKRLAFLLGDWEGTGWIQMGRERATFRQQETVRTAAGGTVVIIDGLGRSLDPAQADRIVHQAFAVASFDAAQQAFRWRAFRAEGNEIEARPEVSQDKLVWGFTPPQGPAVRFTITKTAAGEWFEIGEVSMKPGEWMKFFEMTLKKKGSS
jgi:hypothetical protein